MTVWKHWDNWTYEYFDLDEKTSIFSGAEEFVELWNKKRGSRQIPKWSDFDWQDLSPWWGSIVVTDLFWDPFDYQYRLFGTNVVDQFDVDVTGMKASELTEGNYSHEPEDMEFYEMVSRAPYIARTSGSIYWQDREYVEVTFVELPLSDTGERITHSISLML